MSIRATQKQLRSTSIAPSKSCALPTAKVRVVADDSKGLRPRPTLVDIGNNMTKPKVRADAEKTAVEGCHRLSTVRSTRASTRRCMVIRGARRFVFKKVVLPPETKPSQPEPQTSTSVEVGACAPAEDMLCQVFPSVNPRSEDLDGKEDDELSLCSSYVNDIYSYLRELEEKRPVKCNYLAGQEVNGNRRAMLVDWLVEVHMQFSLQEDTLFMTVTIIDHFLQVGSEQYVLAKYLMELCIVDYDMVHFPPSRIAAAAFCLSLKLLDGCKLLPSLEHYMSYTESDLIPVMQHIAKNIVLLNKDVVQQKTVMTKYARSTNMKISTIKQLQSSIIQDLAEPLVKKL
ncbi:G2/mitotic-specific cyclin-B2-like protein [Willisornis vidua]|uniref:G2/mitotic-specific cyclin-B2-like protein n=1 Tax=Willisornis vidua TaxID=1566151 RepID=A0ABQ9D5D7_9PASS|nr:G2/mitotic-specific cyclin-B2-like protein [Willisornis vidua]